MRAEVGEAYAPRQGKEGYACHQPEQSSVYAGNCEGLRARQHKRPANHRLQDGWFVLADSTAEGLGKRSLVRLCVGNSIVVDCAGYQGVAELSRGMEIQRGRL